MHALARRVLVEGFERRDLRARGATDAPRLLQHARAPVAPTVEPLRHVVVHARGEEVGVAVDHRAVVAPGLLDRAAQRRRWIDAGQQRVEVAAHQQQVGAAVDLLPGVVAREALLAAVADDALRHDQLPDAVGLGLFQVGFEHEAFGGDRAVVHRIETALERIDAVDHLLAAPAGRRHGLQAHAADVEQRPPRNARLVQAEAGEAGQGGIADLHRDPGRPAQGPHGVGADERMADRLGGDEGMRHHAAEEVVHAGDAHGARLVRIGERVARHEVERVRPRLAGVVGARERPALERRQALRNVGARGVLVFAAVALRTHVPGDDAARGRAGGGFRGHDGVQALFHRGLRRRPSCPSCPRRRMAA
ncbi:hypothetical protein D9M72_261890 [compost metagenome]